MNYGHKNITKTGRNPESAFPYGKPKGGKRGTSAISQRRKPNTGNQPNSSYRPHFYEVYGVRSNAGTGAATATRVPTAYPSIQEWTTMTEISKKKIVALSTGGSK